MPTIPRLNQKCDYSVTSQDKFGDKTKTIVKRNVSCRLTEYFGNYKDSRGNDINYQASLHLSNLPLVEKGGIITFENKDFQILDVTQTRDLRGKVFFQFCYLKETNVV